MTHSTSDSHKSLYAIFCVVGAALFLAVMDALVKDLLATYQPAQIVWVRYVGQVFWVFVILLLRQSLFKKPMRSALHTNHLKLQILRSLCLFGGTFSLFTGLAHVPLSIAAAIAELAPIFVTILAAVLLKEHVGVYRWSMVALGLIGGMLIMKPFAGNFNLWLLLPLGTAICFSGYYIVTRYLGTKDSPWTTLFYTALLGSVVATCIIGIGGFWYPPTLIDAAIFAILSLLGALGHLLLIVGFSSAPASVVAPFTYMGLVWAGLLGIIFFQERPDTLAYAGAACIVFSGLVILYRERKANIKNRALVRKGLR